MISFQKSEIVSVTGGGIFVVFEKQIVQIRRNLRRTDPFKNGHVDVLIDQEVAKQGSRPIKILYNYLLTGEKPESPMIYVKNEIFLSQSFPEK